MLNLQGATSTEFNEHPEHDLIIFMPEISTSHMGGTMRLGSRQTIFREYEGHQSIAAAIYENAEGVYERHRHRYEVNPDYVPQLEEAGLMFTGVDDKGQRMEIIELSREDHPFYLACQFHPEFKTRPQSPSPPFAAFVLAAAGLWEQNKFQSSFGRASPRTVQ